MTPRPTEGPPTVRPSKAVGKSWVYRRELKGASASNTVYVRESKESVFILEIGPPETKNNLFFIAVFPKSLKTSAGSK